MLVYGDHSEIADPRERLSSLADELARIAALPSGIARHADLVGALITAGQLQQGVEDQGCASVEFSQFVCALARAVVRSLDSHYDDIGVLPPVPAIDAPRAVELRLPEGFVFYAVYPEQFIAAARELKLHGPPRVIGIRSIGTTLGAVVSATLGAPPPRTVRPFGHPFARKVELPSEAIEQDVHYVIVDEGPGLSGSSFGAVADWLETHGVSPERIAFLPSHDGDLRPAASEAHRRRWQRAQRVPACFDPAFLTAMFGRLEPFSTGGPWERLKYFAERDGERLLLKFAGLGAIGARKFEMARALHAAGFTPEPLAMVHGFLIERWIGDGEPLAPDDKPAQEIGRYIGARAKLFPAPQASGASIEQLLTMCERNLSLALGGNAAGTLGGWDAADLERRVVRVRTDNKLDRHEWLRRRDGRLVKTDAIDHHQGHDLIGSQDAAWDIAGAIVEFDLSRAETEELIAASGLEVDRSLLGFFRLAYLAFRLGQANLAAQIMQSPATRDARRYRHLLHLLLRSVDQHQDSAGILA